MKQTIKIYICLLFHSLFFYMIYQFANTQGRRSWIQRCKGPDNEEKKRRNHRYFSTCMRNLEELLSTYPRVLTKKSLKM
jgi:hypothetical protein